MGKKDLEGIEGGRAERKDWSKEEEKKKKASRALPFYFQGCAGGMTGRSTGGSDRAFGIF